MIERVPFMRKVKQARTVLAQYERGNGILLSKYSALVFNGLNTTLPCSFNVSFHIVQFIGGVALPMDDLSYHAQWVLGAVGQCRIAGVFLVRQIGIIFNRSGRLYHVDSAGFFTKGQLGSPDRRIQGACQVDVISYRPFPVVGVVPWLNEISWFQVGLSAVEVTSARKYGIGHEIDLLIMVRQMVRKDTLGLWPFSCRRTAGIPLLAIFARIPTEGAPSLRVFARVGGDDASRTFIGSANLPRRH